MRLLVTGATGYIGERLVRVARDAGHEVVAASRRKLLSGEWLHFDLASAQTFAIPGRIDAIVHLAADTASSGSTSALEVSAAQHLVQQASRLGARLIFVSSQTAREDAPTAYGRTKYRIEQVVLQAGGLVVRPGQVYGGREAGLFGMLVGIVRRLPVLPAFLPSPRVQPVHVDDLAHALLRAATIDDLALFTLCIGSAEPVSFTHFIRCIAQGRLRRAPLFLPVPSLAATVAHRVIGARFGLDRFASLMGLPMMETQASLDALGIQLRPLLAGMSRSGSDRRRRLLRESVTMLAYVLRHPPRVQLAMRYVRCVERLRQAQPLGLPAIVHRFPVLLALLDRRAAPPDEVAWRIDAAVTLAEATVEGSTRYLRVERSTGPLTAAARMSLAVISEVMWRGLRAVASPLLARFGKPGA